MLLPSLLVVGLLASASLQCAPHAPSRPWTNTTHVSNHHHQTVQQYYLDNRTIYNKLVQIEKRIENIEKRENVLPPVEPEKKPEKKKQEEKTPEEPISPEPESETPQKDCQTCSTDSLVLASCDNCLQAVVSSPFEYYSCMAVDVKCADGSVKLKVSESVQLNIVENDFLVTCQKGKWVLAVRGKEQKVDAISCLSK